MILLTILSIPLILSVVAFLIRPTIAFQILLALFRWDKNRSYFRRSLQLISRFSWELPQSYIGFSWAMLTAIFSNLTRTHSLAGVLCIHTYKANQKLLLGLSLSPYIFISGPDKHYNPASSSIFMHEYGHSLDSQRLGIFYLIAVGIPSIVSAAREDWSSTKHTSKHEHKSYELRATRLAKAYFYRYYGKGIDRHA